MVYKYRGAIGFISMIILLLSSAFFGSNVLAYVERNYFVTSEALKGFFLFGSATLFFIATAYLACKVFDLLVNKPNN